MSRCVNCNLGVQSKHNLQCDCCQGSLHLSCKGLSESDIKNTRAKSKNLKVFCNICGNNISQFKSLKIFIEKVQSDFNNSIAQLRKDLSTRNLAI